MTVLNQLQTAYGRIRSAEDRLQALSESHAMLIARAETDLTQARQELDAIGHALGYAMPEAPQVSPPPDSVPYPELAALSHDA